MIYLKMRLFNLKILTILLKSILNKITINILIHSLITIKKIKKIICSSNKLQKILLSRMKLIGNQISVKI